MDLSAVPNLETIKYTSVRKTQSKPLSSSEVAKDLQEQKVCSFQKFSVFGANLRGTPCDHNSNVKLGKLHN